MTQFRILRSALGVAATAGIAVLAGCATTTPPQKFRTFFLPPAPPPAEAALSEPPPLALDLYANEVPSLSASFPVIARPTDAEFLIKRADDRYAAGKRAIKEGRIEDARWEFNRAIEILLSAPEDAPDRLKVEQRLDELIESVYRYDTGELGASQPDAQVSYDKSPLDEILDLTFPVDPSLRNKVRDQIQATTSQLPLQVNDPVLSYINFFSSPRGKKILEAGLRRSGRYKGMIEKALAAEGLPQELIFVAQAESGFQPHAISNKLCVGVWQFAKFRGEEYGLKVTPAMDLRMDPEQATRAAARHLHDLYDHLGDWYLAMAAYNCGPLCIDRAVQRTGYADFWTLRRMGVLPQETANYVPAILAMIIVSKNAADYGVEDVVADPPMEFDTTELAAPTNLALVASAMDRPVSEIRELNPAVLKNVAPAGYRLHIPLGTTDRLEEAFAVVPPNHRDSWRVQRAEFGDPEGRFVAVPVAPVAEKPAVVKRAAAPAKTHTSAAATVKKPAVASVAAGQKKETSHRATAVAQKTTPKNVSHRVPGA
ncbi:MAG: lytic transglycosylase domain-containing protein [Bryobacterales bacterium]|nr:lytic transglycosylase domain-containing protein [Bryobacterales bacterium]MBV9398162.1 lytic transglycosylase domain-containing protein [Bryobacterales bacterium]